jgi:hypothetical protein
MENTSTELTCRDSTTRTKNRSYVGREEGITWKAILQEANLNIRKYEYTVSNGLPLDDWLKVQYHAGLCVFHTQPLEGVKYCEAYNLIMATLQMGEIMIFGDWCLYYGLSDVEFVEQLKTNKELQLVLLFFDTLYNKLNIVGKIVDTNALKRYESSRGLGLFIPYEERAQIAENTTRAQMLANMGEDVLRRMLNNEQ